VPTCRWLFPGRPVFTKYPRLAGVIELVEEVAFQHMDSRLAGYLLSNRDSKSDTVLRTHESIAVDLGTSREVVSRLLKDFEQRGWVRLSRKEIKLLSVSGLKKSS